MILLFVGKHVKEVDKRVCVQSVAATLNDCMVVVVGGGAVHLLGVLVGDAIGVCRRMRIQKWGTLLILVGLVRVGCCRAGTEFKREVIACS